MKIALAGIVFLGCSASTFAAEPDVKSILKRLLGPSLELPSAREVRYCPDNTCDIYRIAKGTATGDLYAFVFLHLYHESGYAYLSQAPASQVPFRVAAADSEGEIRKRAEHYCKEVTKSPSCILSGMRKELRISLKMGRFDEGKFVED